MKKIVIAGGGFAGLNAAKKLGNKKGIQVTLLDKQNHHLFQPLLYQVAMAGLNPSDIATPIRSILSNLNNVKILQGEVIGVAFDKRMVVTDFYPVEYDYLVLACGADLSYFGNEEWEEYAPGLKTLSQATEIRRRVLSAFERAEKEQDPEKQKFLLTFIVVGGGPTGVELAGAIGEISHSTLARDFRNIDPTLTKILLVEMGERILPSFSEDLARKAAKDLEKVGVQVWISSKVSKIGRDFVQIGEEKINCYTTLWAAGVKPSILNKKIGLETDKAGRAYVEADLSLKNHSEVFVGGDMAYCKDKNGNPLPGLAPVAVQQGRFIAKNILREINGKEREQFVYNDKGQLATIGRSSAIVESQGWKLSGFFAWIIWLMVHIYYLIGFRNKLFVFMAWGWSYITFKKGARLIIEKQWKEATPSQ